MPAGRYRPLKTQLTAVRHRLCAVYPVNLAQGGVTEPAQSGHAADRHLPEPDRAFTVKQGLQHTRRLPCRHHLRLWRQAVALQVAIQPGILRPVPRTWRSTPAACIRKVNVPVRTFPSPSQAVSPMPYPVPSTSVQNPRFPYRTSPAAQASRPAGVVRIVFPSRTVMAGRGTGITCSPLRRTETAFVFICVFPSPTFQTQGLRVLVTGPPSFSSPLKSSPACSTPAHRTAADWRPAVKSSFVSLCSSSPCPFFTGPSPSHSARPATAPACFLSAGAAQNPRRRTHRPPPAGSPGRQPARPD